MATVHLVQMMMEKCGINPRRLALEWASAAEAPLYVSLITQFTDRVRMLGPLGQGEESGEGDLIRRLTAALNAAGSVKLRTRFGKLAQVLRKEANCSFEFIRERVAEGMDGVVASELERAADGAVHLQQAGDQEGIP